MTRLLSRILAAERERNRSRDRATGRLDAARRGFDRSSAALRKAALDHVDCQVLVSTTLRAALARLRAAEL